MECTELRFRDQAREVKRDDPVNSLTYGHHDMRGTPNAGDPLLGPAIRVSPRESRQFGEAGGAVQLRPLIAVPRIAG